MNNNKPLFLVRYWIKEHKDRQPPTLKHTIFYEEKALIDGLRNIVGNYFVYEIGKEYLPKSHFDAIFQKEKEDKELEVYNKLKEKFEK